DLIERALLGVRGQLVPEREVLADGNEDPIHPVLEKILIKNVSRLSERRLQGSQRRGRGADRQLMVGIAVVDLQENGQVLSHAGQRRGTEVSEQRFDIESFEAARGDFLRKRRAEVLEKSDDKPGLPGVLD